MFTEKDLMNKTITGISVDGYGVTLITKDGLKFEYSASDGGYSCWSIEQTNRAARYGNTSTGRKEGR